MKARVLKNAKKTTLKSKKNRGDGVPHASAEQKLLQSPGRFSHTILDSGFLKSILSWVSFSIPMKARVLKNAKKTKKIPIKLNRGGGGGGSAGTEEGGNA